MELIDTKLDPSQVQQSNQMLFNGVPIEEIINIEIRDNYCGSCSDLIGKDIYCRTVIFAGNTYEDVPAKAICEAALVVLGIKQSNKDEKFSENCCCNNKVCC